MGNLSNCTADLSPALELGGYGRRRHCLDIPARSRYPNFEFAGRLEHHYDRRL
jgi:hypothetical protein